ncbi:unnamed protein product [Caenorhabditis bovis]|uniref:G-protein coupled receptors family 1 profile domain-containing protein n=1 Tax=Caenorhabditis bovis TaxID=2654633 RepID=A0A8S1EFS6_9PELO|nr:unnamed protein product [Caenorhabditis bovis]
MNQVFTAGQYMGFVFAQIANWLFLYLIITKNTMKIGTYRYLMISYAIFSIVYSIIEVISLPIIFSKGPAFYICVGSFLKYNRNLGIPLAKNFEVDSFRIAYTSLLYYSYDMFGNIQIRWSEWIGVFLVFLIMAFSILTMIIFGIKIFTKMKGASFLSPKTKDLNRQLFRALVFQSIIPIVLMILPVSILFTFPMFSLGIGKYANIPCLSAALYPGIEASVNIFIIRDFRRILMCTKRSRTFHLSTTAYSGVQRLSA